MLTAFLWFIFFTACNDSTKTTAKKNDSTAVPQNEMSNTEMMKPMHDMMAKMHTIPITGDFDMDFIHMMIEHHQGAIDMAGIEIYKGSDGKMKAMAQRIIEEQTEEQKMLRDIEKDHKVVPTKSDSTHHHEELKVAMDNMMVRMTGLPFTGNTDKDFAMMMIPHHESAIEMAKREVEHAKNSHLKGMAQKAITDQTKEINELNMWLAEHQ